MYELETDVEALGDVEGLPALALLPYAEVLSMLEIAPWGARAYNPRSPEGNMRVVPFGPNGEGLAIYLYSKTSGGSSCYACCGSGSGAKIERPVSRVGTGL